MSAFFVSPSAYLDMSRSGGVQWCTRDYLRTLDAAGPPVSVQAFDADRSLFSRIGRKISPRPFAGHVSKVFVRDLVAHCQQECISAIYLNNTSALALAPVLRKLLGSDLKLIFLSHGVENTDLVNSLRLQPLALPRHMRRPSWLGAMMKEELRHREAIDGVVCISEEDMLFEHWLGAKSQVFIPRTVEKDHLEWHPLSERVGTVSTLDHGPNIDGIRKLALELERLSGTIVRLVGGPESIGKALEKEFRAIEYVGRLDDGQLRMEASSWSAFINPVFCQARGASTKVATALGWGLPVLTTRIGSRGYRWDDAELPRSADPKGLATMIHDYANHQACRLGAERIRALAPSYDDAAKILNQFLTVIGRK